MTSIELPFALGEVIWVPRGSRTERRMCPECAGTRIITLIKGNGEQVRLGCEHCRLGYDPSRGYVEVQITHREPTRFTPSQLHDMRCGDFHYRGDEVEGTVNSKEMFRTREECQAWCDEENARCNKAEEERQLAIISNNRRTMAHSASYWRSQEKQLLQQLERVRARMNH
jgi:hypothetical protein